MTKDTNTSTASGAAIQRYKIGYHADEWGQRSSTPSGIPDASGSWVRYADHIATLAAGQATAAPAGAVPLTLAQIAEIADAAHREYNGLVSSGQCAPRWSAVFAHLLEMHHGIKGG